MVCVRGMRYTHINDLTNQPPNTNRYEDTDPDAPHVQAFWEVLAEMAPEERTDFLRFTWARSRMPASGA